MAFQDLAAATYRALTARKDGPSLYDVCDPHLLNGAGGDPHLAKFYQNALGTTPRVGPPPAGRPGGAAGAAATDRAGAAARSSPCLGPGARRGDAGLGRHR